MLSLEENVTNRRRLYKSAIAGLVALSAILSFASGTTRAAPLNITNIQGGWANANPSANATIANALAQGTDLVTWGGVNPPSGYEFTPGANVVPVIPGTAFSLGVFRHINEPIPSGTSITDIDYNFQFDTNGIPANLMTVIEFSHDETPNPAPDIVTITSVNLNSLITVGTDVYYFSLLGFSVDGGNTFSNIFTSPEGSTNSATLYGIVTTQPLGTEVPVPASACLLLTGVLGLAGFRKKLAWANDRG